jgi:hypothetical protein
MQLVDDKMEVPMIGTVLGDRYRILSQLGSGGMGEVYLAEHINLGRREAIKILKPQLAENRQLVARFRREARAANRVQHPNIVGVYDFGQLPDGRFFLAMEYADGKDLATHIAESGPMPVTRALSILAQLVEGVAHAHRSGVVHRDLKPENLVLVERRDQPPLLKIFDFGIAKIISPDHVSAKLTNTGEIFGTIEYMAPEQLVGAPDIDPRCDLYAVGCIAFELLVGQPPFSGKPMQVVSAHLNKTPDAPSQRRPGIPAELDELVLRCLRKDAAARFQTADDLLAALRRVPGYREQKPLSGRRHLRKNDFDAAQETEERRLVDAPAPELDAITAPANLDDLKTARHAAVREVAEALLDLGYSGYALLMAMTELRRDQDEILRCDSEMVGLDRRAEELERSAIERESSLRFAVGELRFALGQAQAEGLATQDLEAQIAELDQRLSDIHAESERALAAVTDCAIELTAARAVASDRLDDLFARIEPIIDEEGPRYARNHPSVEQTYSRLKSFREMLRSRS